ncbi:MAG TPA: glycosyltransferase family 2 protein [Fervidobacterium sp.]|nr:glycosyltransferase family 2 protein [Fervidobacterium sp.]
MDDDLYTFFFVVLNYIDYEMTTRAVQNIVKSVTGYQNYGVLIVDNCSPNGSYEVLKERFVDIDNVFVIKNEKNEGYAKGNNFGAKYIERRFRNCKYIAIMNPDVEFFERTNLGKIVDKLNSDPQLASLSPVHLFNGKLDPRRIAWKTQKGFGDVFLTFSITSRMFHRMEYRDFKIEPNKLSYVEALPGSFFVIKMEPFKQIGYFDENTFLYYEEVILAKKLMNAGYKQAVDFESFFIHNHEERNRPTISYRIRHSKYLLLSRVYYNLTYNKPFGPFVAVLLYILYPIRIIEIFVITLLKGLKK